MSYSIDTNTNEIQLTRGDTLVLGVAIYRNDEQYTPVTGDTVRFALKRALLVAGGKAYADTEPLVLKDIPINTMQLRLDSDDTKSLPFGDYEYDIQITFADGTVDTFITAAPFKITREVD